MPLFKDERELVRNWLKPSLEKQGYMVERFVGFDKIHSKLRAEHKLTDEELATDWPAQPEIDLIFWPKSFQGEPTLYAAEVKYFRLTNGALYPEIYSGIGEAIAILGFGFDAVFLWHLFDPEIPDKIVTRSKSYLESLITSSGSAINYRARTLPKL